VRYNDEIQYSRNFIFCRLRLYFPHSHIRLPDILSLFEIMKIPYLVLFTNRTTDSGAGYGIDQYFLPA
jgi:hypothetical protein